MDTEQRGSRQAMGCYSVVSNHGNFIGAAGWLSLWSRGRSDLTDLERAQYRPINAVVAAMGSLPHRFRMTAPGQTRKSTVVLPYAPALVVQDTEVVLGIYLALLGKGTPFL